MRRGRDSGPKREPLLLSLPEDSATWELGLCGKCITGAIAGEIIALDIGCMPVANLLSPSLFKTNGMYGNIFVRKFFDLINGEFCTRKSPVILLSMCKR